MTTFLVRISVDDSEHDEPINPEIIMVDLLANPDAEQWVKWEIVQETSK